MVGMAAILSACALIDQPGDKPMASDPINTDKPEIAKGDMGMEIDAVPAREQLEAEKAALMVGHGTPEETRPQNNLLGWYVSLNINGDGRRWPGQPAELIATANQDIGPTPWYLIIVEHDWLGSRVIKICGTGVSCGASVTSSSSINREYIAYVAAYANALPIPNQQAVSNVAYISWSPPLYLSLRTDRSTLIPGESTVLTATTDLDVGPSPWYISIVDVTTETLLIVCGSGKTCAIAVSQGLPTTHSYIAYLVNSTSLPFTSILLQTQPSYVTWTSSGFVVDLQEYYAIGSDKVIATTNANVGPTPYYITIFDVYTGALLTACGFGTSCALDVTSTSYCGYMVAFVSANGYFLPANIQANSQTILHVCIN